MILYYYIILSCHDKFHITQIKLMNNDTNYIRYKEISCTILGKIYPLSYSYMYSNYKSTVHAY